MCGTIERYKKKPRKSSGGWNLKSSSRYCRREKKNVYIMHQGTKAGVFCEVKVRLGPWKPCFPPGGSTVLVYFMVTGVFLPVYFPGRETVTFVSLWSAKKTSFWRVHAMFEKIWCFGGVSWSVMPVWDKRIFAIYVEKTMDPFWWWMDARIDGSRHYLAV